MCDQNPEKIIEILLGNRKIDNVYEFLNPNIANVIPSSIHLIDIDKAVKRIVHCIFEGKKVAIFGDYDVDGISSTAILVRFFKHIGVSFEYFIPNRNEDGYGFNIQSIEKHKDCLIAAVDCGSKAIAELEYATKNRIDIVVIDHHKMDTVPNAVAIVNPHRPDEKDDYKNLCAAGLVFLVLTEIHRELIKIGFYGNKKINEPNLLDYLDLVALATVCDVVELTGLNRLFVTCGIKSIQEKKNIGINALVSLNKSKIISSDIIAFFLGPKINAAGRLSSAEISLKLLTTDDFAEAEKIAKQLDELNKTRQQIEAEMIENILTQVDETIDFICSYGRQLHVGIIGIVAGKLKEKYNKPTIVISINENGIGRASCRSVANVDISEIINKGIKSGIIAFGGGHTMAGGFTIEESKIGSLIEFLRLEIKHETKQIELYADCFMPLEAISVNLLERISILEPFGAGNRHPKFIIPNVKIKYPRIVGANHIQITLESKEKHILKAISFRSAGTALGNLLMTHSDPINILGSLVISEWNGVKQVNLYIDDISYVESFVA
jgi:single-stranded-DNA-specific exonuclease